MQPGISPACQAQSSSPGVSQDVREPRALLGFVICVQRGDLLAPSSVFTNSGLTCREELNPGQRSPARRRSWWEPLPGSKSPTQVFLRLSPCWGVQMRGSTNGNQSLALPSKPLVGRVDRVMAPQGPQPNPPEPVDMLHHMSRRNYSCLSRCLDQEINLDYPGGPV